jgi:chromosome partitioning protein
LILYQNKEKTLNAVKYVAKTNKVLSDRPERPPTRSGQACPKLNGRPLPSNAALILSDVLIVPFAPRSYDVWALDDMAALVDEARSVRDGLRAFAVLNLADPGESSADNAEAAAAVADVPQFTYLSTPIRRRKAFSNAGGSGLSVAELSPRDPKACAELDALTASLFNIQLIA